MSLTTCIRRAGDALRAEDKAEILAAAAKYRKAGMGADEAGRKAVDEQIAKVQAMLEAPAEVAVPAPEPEPVAPAAEQPEAETDAESGAVETKATTATVDEGVPAMPAVLGIPREAAQNAHRGTSHVPEVRAGQEQQSFMAALADAWQRAARMAGKDKAAIERITEVFRDVADGYRARYMRTLEARSRVMSSMIAGPARFPVERNRKRMETERKRAEEAGEYLSRGIKRLLKAARGPIDNSPESELESVRLRLAEREEAQEMMKAANLALRKGDDAALEDLGLTAEQIAGLKKGDFAGRKGFPDYKLTNNNAEIRRLRSRLEEAEARLAAAQEGPQETERAGVRIVEDAQEDRLRLIFDGKPDEAVRETLKANGFRWSPKAGAWQRQLTGNARYAAKVVLDKHFPADGDTRFSRKMKPEVRAANFDAWVAGAEMVSREDATTRGFKTGEAVVVEAYHGTKRPDRVGTVFQRKRATSGPMAFFTSDPALASSYAQGKPDTSLSQDYDGDYAQWFKVKVKGERNPRDIEHAWWSLSPDERARITELAPRVTTQENEDTGLNDIVLGPESVTNGPGSYDYEYAKTKRGFAGSGNPLRALVESWLASGLLFDEELDFLKVLKLAGMETEVEFDSPRADYPFVYKTLIRMGNPLVTSDIPAKTMTALEEAAKRDRSRADAGGADSWDKNTRTLREWVAQLKDPERGTYAWTSIPDKVTEVLKAEGYDGIIDWSGKGGGDIVAPVYVPFVETQVKSALGNRGTFDAEKKDILYSRASTGRGIPESDARNLASILRAALPKAPPIIIHDSVDKAPQSLRDAIYAEGAERDVEAAYHEGEIHVFPGHIESAERFNFVVGHHEMRHYGIRGILGQQYKQVLTGIAMRNPTLRAAARAKQDAGLAKDLATGVDEALADMPVEEIAALSGIDRLVSRIRQWLRETAAKLREHKLFALADAIDPKEWTDKDVAHFVWKVEDFARRGGSPMSTGGTMFSSAAQTDTEAFRKWFGDSKVVDENGEPLVVYHGTPKGEVQFEERDRGIFFTSNHKLAGDYTRQRGAWISPGKSPAVYPAYLSMQNPLLIDAAGKRNDNIPVPWQPWKPKVFGNLPANAVNVERALAYARENGHDGLIVRNVNDAATADETRVGDVYAVLRPEQIKSATGNRGTFDPADPDIRFSRAPGLNMSREAMASQDLVNARGGVFDFNRLGETKQDRIRTVIDGARPFWLGALTRDQIADVFGDEIPPVRDYDQLTRSMENERQKMAQDADKLYNEWAKLPEAANDRLARIMLDATVNSVHPDKDAGLPKKATPEQRAVHARIRAEFKALPPEAQAMYGKVKAFHENTLAQLRQAIEARIDRQVENGAAKQATLTNIRKMFDKYMENGPYFPLSRFGDFLVIGTRGDGERVVAAYENAGEQQAAARALQADGFTVKMKTSKTYSRETDGSAGQFIGDVMLTLEKVDMVEATINGSRTDLKNQLLDDINQLFIKSLPDLSYRKHFTHRKNTPGFSADVMRGFAASAFHSASHIARVNHGDQMTFALRDAYSAIENAPEGDFNKHTQVLNELTKRHDAALNPNTHPIASMLNQVGFVMYLGLSPAAGLVNLLQTPMVTLPHLGARYGFRKASASMGKATSDIMAAPMNKQSGWDATASDKLTAAEKAAMRELQDEGIIDLTQAHDLASASGLDTGNVARSKAAFAMARAMKIVGWTFHVPEVMNRQVTALSAYRLEMERSNDDAKAKEAAREAIRRTHFDYSSSNRARYMQGNIARVVMQFKQYAQNMTYLLGRAAQQALSGETPEVRRIARRQLVATLAATFGMAGALGLPGLGAAMGLIGMMVDALDDDDEPWEWKVELRNLLADTAGKEFGEVISHGVPRALMPWDLAGRVGMGDLWWRDSGRESDNPREALGATAVSVLGPTAGTVLGWYTASDHMARGDYSKAAEAIVPKFIRDPLKAVRESQEGVTSYTGEPLKDVTAAEVIGRLFGFAPASVSEMYEGKNAVMTPKTVLEQKRSRLLSQVAKARIDKDAERERELREKIAEFNRRNPEFKITGASIVKSVIARRRNRENTENGIMLPDTKDFLRERARFAVTQ